MRRSDGPAPALALALTLAVALPVATAVPAVAGPAPGVVAVAPNPVAANDRGEFVVVRVPARGNWTLGDGETRVDVPAVGGRVALSPDPAAAATLTDRPVREADLALSNAGERLVLRRDGTRVAVTTYGDAPEGDLFRDGEWRPLGATNRDPVTVRDAPVDAFLLPDSPGLTRRTLGDAEERLYLAAYTVSDPQVGTALAAAAARGVDVRVLVEGGPVGGVSRREARLLDRLAARNVTVRVVDGPRARYRFHHAKYAVVDDRALVTTENWVPGGVGGHGNRGWGVRLANDTVADSLADLFRGDSDWRAAKPWRTYRANASFVASNRSTASFPSRFPPRRVRADRVDLLVAPDNAAGRLEAAVRSAEDTLRVEQPSLAPGTPLYAATVDAARRGVRVRVLLSDAWYARERNRRAVRRLRRRAREADLPLRARLVRAHGRFDGVHAKGVVVDGETVFVGSVNWTNTSLRENREVGLLVSDPRVAGYYVRAFRADWRGGRWRVTVGAVAAALVVALVAVAALSGVRFSDGGRSGGPRRSRRPPSSR